MRAVPDAELAEDVRHVRLHRRLTEVEPACDLRVRQSRGELLEDLAFAVGEQVELGCRRRRGRRGAHGAFDDATGHLGGEQTVAVREGGDGVDELLRLGGLEEEAPGARSKGVEEEVVAVEGREHEDGAAERDGRSPRSRRGRP